MKIKYLLLLLLCTTVHSQVKNAKKTEIVTTESQFESKALLELQNKVYSVSEKGLAATIDYSYSKNDGLIKSIIFRWTLNIDRKEPQSDKVRKYNQAFDGLFQSLTEILGKPKPNQGKQTQIESPVEGDTSINYERKVSWKIGSKTVTTIIVWAENHGEQMITTIR